VKYRRLGKSELEVSTVSMGCWAIGGAWGSVSDADSMKALHAAVDAGVNFFDTADVYGDGRSERLVGRLLAERPERLFVATKAGRRLDPHVADGYSRDNLTAFLERSLKELRMERVDLLQLHCPPTEVYYTPEVFGVLDDLKQAGKLREYGVSVERVEEGLKALEYPGVRSIQIIYNIFRQRPADRLLHLAKERGVGVLARVPLASGLLTGKLDKDSSFADDDHRNFNREGQAFDVGETFAGVPYEVGLQAAHDLKELVVEGTTLTQLALRWILQNDGVTCAIPGGKRPDQVAENCAAADLADLPPSVLEQIDILYRERISPYVHQRW
jgi:aryl-alcohol dehydrogenase-like predicted oxidoreductase